MKILIVEDEQKLASYVKRGLEEQGHAIDLVFSGDEAMDWVEAVDHDIIILDIMLPGKDGLTLCKQIRARRMNTPILMLTARDAVDDRVIGLDAGADDYLVKPFALKELSARLRALGRRRGDGSKTTLLKSGDLTLDTATRTAKRGAQAIELRTKEYAVLEYLMRHQGQVLTRQMILDHVWDGETFLKSNVVDVYIRNLRRKIDDPFKKKLIQTVRGSGYKILRSEGK